MLVEVLVRGVRPLCATFFTNAKFSRFRLSAMNFGPSIDPTTFNPHRPMERKTP